MSVTFKYKEEWLKILWIYITFYVVAQWLDLNTIATDCYSRQYFSRNKSEPQDKVLSLCSAGQEIAESINLPHTCPQSCYMVVSAEGNDIFPSSADFWSIHWWLLITRWTGEEGEDVSLCWLWREKDIARWGVSLSQRNRTTDENRNNLKITVAMIIVFYGF